MSELAMGATALALIAAYMLGRRVGRGEGFGAAMWVGECMAEEQAAEEHWAVGRADPEGAGPRASLDPTHLAVQRRRAGWQ